MLRQTSRAFGSARALDRLQIKILDVALLNEWWLRFYFQWLLSAQALQILLLTVRHRVTEGDMSSGNGWDTQGTEALIKVREAVPQGCRGRRAGGGGDGPSGGPGLWRSWDRLPRTCSSCGNV